MFVRRQLISWIRQNLPCIVCRKPLYSILSDLSGLKAALYLNPHIAQAAPEPRKNDGSVTRAIAIWWAWLKTQVLEVNRKKTSTFENLQFSEEWKHFTHKSHCQ